jgi:hypothetical protein|tara:strand:+ start:1252 stop:1512 length:261 start_codon:yes stop_codon:yes gene_type:complete
MAIKKISVTRTSSYSIDGEGIVTRERIVEMSHNWSERDVTLFKKIAKQGGSCKLQGVKYVVQPGERVTTSHGWADGGVGKMHGPEE